MSRRYVWHKEPCKNLALVVKNSVKIALPLKAMATYGSAHGYLLSCRDPVPEAEAVFTSIYESLQSKLRDKTFDIPDLWVHLVGLGVNPVDMVFPLISKTHIWSVGGISFVPNLSSDTEGRPHSTPFDHANAVRQGQICDSLIKSTLSLPTIAYTSATSAAFADPRARIFSAFLTVENPFSVCAYSTELSDCFDAWVDELSSMEDEYKMMGVSRVLHCLKDLPGVSSPSYACPDEFRIAARAIVDRVIGKISEVRIGRELKDPHDTTELNRYGVVFDYLDVSKEDRLKLCKKIAEIGNDALSISVMDGLIRSPKNYAKACSEIGLSGVSALNFLGQNLTRAAWFNSKVYGDPSKVAPLVEALREEFKSVGYQDPAGTIAFDFLSQNLELAEHFEKLDFIRREPLSNPSMFLKRYDGEVSNQPAPAGVVIRKVELAIKLNQQELLRNEVELFFKGHKNQSKNSDLGGEKAIRHLLESGYFDASEILINDTRREKAMSMGVSGKALLPAGGATLRIKTMAIEHDLGL